MVTVSSAAWLHPQLLSFPCPLVRTSDCHNQSIDQLFYCSYSDTDHFAGFNKASLKFNTYSWFSIKLDSKVHCTNKNFCSVMNASPPWMCFQCHSVATHNTAAKNSESRRTSTLKRGGARGRNTAVHIQCENNQKLNPEVAGVCGRRAVLIDQMPSCVQRWRRAASKANK